MCARRKTTVLHRQPALNSDLYCMPGVSKTPDTPLLATQHAYVYIHELAREAVEAAAEVKKGGGKAREAGPALRRLRSWGFLQSLQVGREGGADGARCCACVWLSGVYSCVLFGNWIGPQAVVSPDRTSVAVSPRARLS